MPKLSKSEPLEPRGLAAVFPGRVALWSPWPNYLCAVGSIGLCTVLASWLFPYLTITNLLMIYLLAVVITAALLGWGPSLVAALLSVAALAFFFIPPYYSFGVENPEYVISLAVLLTVSTLISHLTARIRRQAEDARRQGEQTALLYQMCQTLPAMLSLKDMLREAVAQIARTFDSRVAVLMPDTRGQLHLAAGEPFGDEYGSEMLVARWVFRHAHPAGVGTGTLPKAKGFYLPLRTAQGVTGVLRLQPEQPGSLADPQSLRFLEALGTQITLALEREMFLRQAQDAQVEMETERLRNTLLSSVSHDLRTPLTVIAGSASTLMEGEAHLDPRTKGELVQNIYEEACRLERLVNNLLEMSRLQAGAVTLLKEWNLLEEVIGTALTQLEVQLRNHPVRVSLPPDLPLVQIDTTLMERVLINLLENAAKYTEPGTAIDISARTAGGELMVEVADHGPGLPPGAEERIFEKFYQTAPGQSRGAGLGLAICRSIIAAHGGQIWAASRPGGGAVFVFTLPLEEDRPRLDKTLPDLE